VRVDVARSASRLMGTKSGGVGIRVCMAEAALAMATASYDWLRPHRREKYHAFTAKLFQEDV
jgi:hypothetical protein